MKRLLVLCPRDWLNPESGVAEHYLHEVFARIVGHGHYVAWVSHSYPVRSFGRKPAPQLEIVDGIQIARLGFRYFHRALVAMLLSRLTKNGAIQKSFDAIVDCISGYPTSAAEQTPVPVVPLVFHLHPKVRPTEHSPRPVIAVTDQARRQLAQAGVPDTHIIHAPFAVDTEVYAPGNGQSPSGTLVIVDRAPKRVLRALKRSGAGRVGCELHLIGGRLRRPGRFVAYHHPFGDEDQRAAIYQTALFGYCGEGLESEALALAACGVPVVCPATPSGREYVIDNETGLLFEPGDRAGLSAQLARLARDEVLRKRLSVRAQERARVMSWDKTASLVLAAIENL